MRDIGAGSNKDGRIIIGKLRKGWKIRKGLIYAFKVNGLFDRPHEAKAFLQTVW